MICLDAYMRDAKVYCLVHRTHLAALGKATETCTPQCNYHNVLLKIMIASCSPYTRFMQRVYSDITSWDCNTEEIQAITTCAMTGMGLDIISEAYDDDAEDRDENVQVLKETLGLVEGLAFEALSTSEQ